MLLASELLVYKLGQVNRPFQQTMTVTLSIDAITVSIDVRYYLVYRSM